MNVHAKPFQPVLHKTQKNILDAHHYDDCNSVSDSHVNHYQGFVSASRVVLVRPGKWCSYDNQFKYSKKLSSRVCIIRNSRQCIELFTNIHLPCSADKQLEDVTNTIYFY